jgi:hypothetical protein
MSYEPCCRTFLSSLPFNRTPSRFSKCLASIPVVALFAIAAHGGPVALWAPRAFIL